MMLWQPKCIVNQIRARLDNLSNRLNRQSGDRFPAQFTDLRIQSCPLRNTAGQAACATVPTATARSHHAIFNRKV